MKTIPVRTTAALAMLLALGACGGKASFELAGTIIDANGVTKPLGGNGLVLANGDQRLPVPFGATTFKFPNTISYGTEYNMTVSQQPEHMTCGFTSGATGTAGRTATIAAYLRCVQNSYEISGIVIGLGSGTLKLVNGADTVSVTASNTSFKMPTPIPVGSVYGVAIFDQPAGQTCTIANGTDVMGDAPRNNIVVTCKNN